MKCSLRKIGGIHFLKIGRLNFSVSVSRPSPRPAPVPVPIDLFALVASIAGARPAPTLGEVLGKAWRAMLGAGRPAPVPAPTVMTIDAALNALQWAGIYADFSVHSGEVFDCVTGATVGFAHDGMIPTVMVESYVTRRNERNLARRVALARHDAL